MSDQFNDVTVTGLDESMSTIVEAGNSSIYLSLSGETDAGWNKAFDEADNQLDRHDFGDRTN